MSKKTAKQIIPFVLLVAVALVAMFVKPIADFAPGEKDPQYSSADIAWVLVSTALVFLMTPGLAFFYGGMVNRKNVISTMIKSVVAAGVVGILWVVCGFSLAFGDTVNGFIGDPTTFAFFHNVKGHAAWPLANTIPLTLFSLFQLMFAVITPGLVVGALAERIRFTSFILFIVLFSLLVYAPVAHWSWHPEGFLAKMGAFDFAGGTVVHITAGCAALAGAMVLKRRKSHVENREIPPANVPYVLIGTGLLWFGWFGFKGKKPSELGFCIGAVVGLVAITPAAGYVGIPQSIIVGLVGALVSNVAVSIKQKSTLDDTLDVFPCHGLGGMVGMLLTGVFASTAVNSAGPNGLFYGNPEFFFTQFKAMGIVVLYSFTVSYGIFKFINFVVPMRVSELEEELGLDETQHNEKYMQGHLLVHHNGEIKETPAEKH